MNKLQKFISGALATLAAVTMTIVIATGRGASLLRAGTTNLVECPNGYKTNFDWNISYEEIVNLAPATESYTTLDGHEEALKNCSEILDSVVSTKGQYYRQETNKLEVKSLKFGTGSAAGSLTLTLTKNIDAIGFYAEAYQHTSDQTDKTLLVNDIETQTLGATYNYDTCQRFYVEFDNPTNKITITAKNADHNRFYIYSIGFYSKNNFPNATTEPEPDSSVEPTEGNTIIFAPTTELTDTAGPISWSNSSNYGTTVTTELRIYKGQTLTINCSMGNIVKVILTCTASGTTKQGPGCFGTGAPTGYTYENKIGTWIGETSSLSFTAVDNQVRITKIEVTYK